MKFRSLLSIVLLAGVVLVGCQSGGNEAPAVSVEPVVEDTVIIEEVEEEKEGAEELSIVAGTVSATQVLAELGANLVGIPTTASVLPEQYVGLPEIGQAMNPDFEIVASLDADLLIMDANFKDKIEESLEAYEMDTFFFNTTTYNNFLESITQLGQVINKEEQALQIVSEIEKATSEALANKTEEAPTVAIIFGAGENFMLATETSYLGDLVHTLGGKNISTELNTEIESAYIQFSLEQILVQNPDYILRFAHGNIEETSKMFDEALDVNPAYQELDAVKNSKVYDLDSSLFNVSANLKVKEAMVILGDILYGN